MKILITGAAGGIGSTLGYYLFKKGHDLYLLDNFRNGYEQNLKINNQTFGLFYNYDVCDLQLSTKIKNNYDCIIHLAAITSLPDCQSNPIETINVNVKGTMNILECARKWNVPHVIFSSTSAVYENNKETIFTEDLLVNPKLWYSLSKKMSEELCDSYQINYGMNVTTLRFFNVFGPKQDIHRKNPPLLNYIVREVKKGNTPILHSDGNQSRDYVYVDDILNLVDLCLEKIPNDTFNVCTGVLLSVNQIVRYVSESLNVPIISKYRESTRLWDSYPDLFSGNYPLDKDVVDRETNKYSKGSYDKVKNTLGWQPNVDLESIFKKVVREIDI